MNAMEDKIGAVLARCKSYGLESGYQCAIPNGVLHRKMNGWYRLRIGSIDLHLDGDSEMVDFESAYSLLSLGVQPPESLIRKNRQLREVVSHIAHGGDLIKDSDLRDYAKTSLDFIDTDDSPAPDENGLLAQVREWLSKAKLETEWNKANALPYHWLSDLQKILDSAPISNREDWAIIQKFAKNLLIVQDKPDGPKGVMILCLGESDRVRLYDALDNVSKDATSAVVTSHGEDIENLKTINDAFRVMHEGDWKALEAMVELKSLGSSAGKDPQPLIEALQGIMTHCLASQEIGGGKEDFKAIASVALDALSAYKGKEAKEGGEG